MIAKEKAAKGNPITTPLEDQDLQLSTDNTFNNHLYYATYLEKNRTKYGLASMNACVSPSNLQLLNVQIIPQPAAAAVASYLPIQNANINLTFNLSMDRTFHHVFNIARDLANYWDDEEMLTIKYVLSAFDISLFCFLGLTRQCSDTISWPNFAAAETVRPKGTNDLIVISCHIGNPRADQLLNSEMWCCYLGCMNQTEQARPHIPSPLFFLCFCL